MLEQLLATLYWENCLKSDQRYADPLRLQRFGYKVFSQFEEDGSVAEIFRRIGEGRRTFVEIGVGDGVECNTLHLLLQGWTGHWVDADEGAFSPIKARMAKHLGNGLQLHLQMVTRENVDSLLRELCPDNALDFLSIDIDGNDYWVWKAIQSIQPRVFVIEYNSTWRPPLSLTVDYDPFHRWDRTNYFGASLSALCELGRTKGYNLVGCCFGGVNADLCGNHFAAPFTAENHYEPPRYWMLQPAGHPAGFGPVTQIPFSGVGGTR